MHGWRKPVTYIGIPLGLLVLLVIRLFKGRESGGLSGFDGLALFIGVCFYSGIVTLVLAVLSIMTYVFMNVEFSWVQ